MPACVSCPPLPLVWPCTCFQGGGCAVLCVDGLRKCGPLRTRAGVPWRPSRGAAPAAYGHGANSCGCPCVSEELLHVDACAVPAAPLLAVQAAHPHFSSRETGETSLSSQSPAPLPRSHSSSLLSDRAASAFAAAWRPRSIQNLRRAPVSCLFLALVCECVVLSLGLRESALGVGCGPGTRCCAPLTRNWKQAGGTSCQA